MRITKLKVTVLTLALLSAVGLVLTVSGRVAAISSILPDWANDYVRTTPNPATTPGFTGNPKALVSEFGYDNSLHSPVSYAKLYFTASSGKQARIYGASFCGYADAFPDNVGRNMSDGIDPNDTYYVAYAAGPNDELIEDAAHMLGQARAQPDPFQVTYTAQNPSFSGGVDLNDVYCNRPLQFNLDSPLHQPSTVEGHQGKYVIYIKAISARRGDWNYSTPGVGTRGVVNSFSVEAMGGTAGFYADNANTEVNDVPPFGSRNVMTPGALTVQDRGGTGNTPGFNQYNTFSDFTFKFAPPCSMPAGNRTGYLKWANLEQGTPLQNPAARFRVKAYDRVTGVGRYDSLEQTPPVDSNFLLVQSFQFPINRDWKYQWEWYGIERINALQIWMPYDSADFDFKCNQPEGEIVRADCDLIEGWAIDNNNPNEKIDIEVYLDGERGTPGARLMSTTVANLGGTPPGYPPRADGHRFSVPFPESFKDTSAHNLYVYGREPNTNNWRRINLNTINVASCKGADCSASYYGPISLTSPVNKDQIEITQNVQFVFGMDYSGLPSPPPIVNPRGTLRVYNEETMQDVIPLRPVTYAELTPGDRKYVFNFSNLALPTKGPYRMNWTFTYDGNITTINCTDTAIGNQKPYVKIDGNDVSAGGYFSSEANAGNCQFNMASSALRNPRASIFTLAQSRDPSASNDPTKLEPFTGSSSQFAISALGIVDQMFSLGRRSPRNAGSPPSLLTDLTFGNYSSFNSSLTDNPTTKRDDTKRDYAPGDTSRVYYGYGGNSGIGTCTPDYFALHPVSTAPVVTSISANTTGVQYVRPPAGQKVAITTTGALAAGSSHTIFIEGDAVIQNNITFASFNRMTDIPSLYIIVKGNLYIAQGVRQLDGIYIAQPTVAANGAPVDSTGTIYTCSSSTGSLYSLTDLHGQCGGAGAPSGNLTVNGAFIAQRIKLLRTNNTRRESVANEAALGSRAAEIFNFSPEAYLSPNIDPSLRRVRTQSQSRTYDYISSLPPIL